VAVLLVVRVDVFDILAGLMGMASKFRCTLGVKYSN